IECREVEGRVVADLACSQAMIWCSGGEMKRFSIKLVQDGRNLIMDDSNVTWMRVSCTRGYHFLWVLC
ncbi:hypothetical protein A2U01_0060038, partial [Trifolium medium]|nr:hypothetical protein [Trifolium medium]